MQKEGQRIEWIDAAKGACILAVVMYHFNVFIFQGIYEGHPIAVLWNVGITALKPLRMPLFFVISGYLASTSVMGRTWAETRTKKVASLLWVYIVWAVIYFIGSVYLLPENPWFDNSLTLETSVLEFVGRMFTASISLWYLYALVIYFALAKLLRSAKLAIGLGIAANFAMFYVVDPSNWGMRSLIGYFVFFAIGVFGKDIITRHYAAFNPKRFVITAAISLAGLGIASKFHALTAPGVEMLLGFVMVATVIDLFALACQYLNLKVLRSLGRQTLPIYVIHRLLLRFLSPYMPDTVNSVLIAVEPLVVTMAVAGACLLIHHALLRVHARGLFTMPHLLRRAAYRTGLLQPVRT